MSHPESGMGSRVIPDERMVKECTVIKTPKVIDLSTVSEHGWDVSKWRPAASASSSREGKGEKELPKNQKGDLKELWKMKPGRQGLPKNQGVDLKELWEPGRREKKPSSDQRSDWKELSEQGKRIQALPNAPGTSLSPIRGGREWMIGEKREDR